MLGNLSEAAKGVTTPTMPLFSEGIPDPWAPGCSPLLAGCFSRGRVGCCSAGSFVLHEHGVGAHLGVVSEMQPYRVLKAGLSAQPRARRLGYLNSL